MQKITALRQLPRVGVLTLWSFFIIAPLLVVGAIAVKPALELLTNPIGWPQQFVWSNFITAWNQANLGTALFNSLLITGGSVIGTILIGASAAYPLARRVGRGINALYFFFIAGLIVPLQFGLIPLYKLLESAGLLDNQFGVILVEIGGQLPFVIFLYTGFLKSVPRELEEAAAIDGANIFRTFWTIVFPLLRPVTATIAILSSLGIWNDFLVPFLTLQSPQNQTITLAIVGFVGLYSQSWNLIFASIIVSSIPIIIVYLLLQRYIVSGIAGGALKG